MADSKSLGSSKKVAYRFFVISAVDKFYGERSAPKIGEISLCLSRVCLYDGYIIKHELFVSVFI